MKVLSYLMIMMVLTGMVSFTLKRKHLLIMLLSLEYIVISIYLGLMVYLMMMNYEFFFLMIYLTMSVCEGALGLSILVLMIRTHGNDYILSFSSLW